MIFVPYYGNSEYVGPLTDEEFNSSWEKGRVIRSSSVVRKFKDRRPEVRNGVDGERVQCLGEVAARAIARHLYLPWIDSMDSFHGPDLSFNIEARLIGRNNYGLRVYDKDFAKRKLVVGCVIVHGNERGIYRIPGWIPAEDGVKFSTMDPYNKNQPFHCVPQDKLWHLDELRAIIDDDTYGIYRVASRKQASSLRDLQSH